MKIGILTFHFACNYGAVLQCYALQRYLTEAGHEVSVVDYRPRSVADGYRWFDIRRFWGSTPARLWRKTTSELKVVGSRRRRYAAFDSFVSASLNLTTHVNDPASMSALADDFDLIIAGSDQIWNSRLTDGIDPIYWGAFERNQGTSMISYAASMEDGFTKETADAVSSLLSAFDALSVREASLKDALEPYLCGRKVSTVVDPTLLLNGEQWSSLASEPLITEPYLLFYQVRRSEPARDAAIELARRKGLRPVFISAKPELENSPEVAEASPEQFVSLFKNASFVVTTSFHGTVFSLIFEKDFICMPVQDGRNSRQENLLSDVGLSERNITKLPEDDLKAIDWASVAKRKAEMLESTYEYLKSCGL